VIWVLLAAWNEEGVIRGLLLDLAQTLPGRTEPFRVVLVDDGSSDRTRAEAERATQEAGASLPLEILVHQENRGLGAALRTGIAWILDRADDDDVLVTMDADRTHPPGLIPTLVSQVRAGADVAIASRYRPGAVVEGVPSHRRVLSEIARVLFQVLYPIPGVRDYTCCFRAYRVPVLRRARGIYGDALCTQRGFEAVVDLLLRLGPLGIRVAETGFELRYAERARASKMKVMRTIFSSVGLLARRRWERWTRYTPERLARLEAGAGRAS
jgi:dolichol-phosphate mannosyltransferase